MVLVFARQALYLLNCLSSSLVILKKVQLIILLEVTYDYFSFVFFVVMLEPRTLHFLVKCSITKVYLSPFLNFKKFKTRAC